MKISLIISTRNRAGRLPACLDAVFKLTCGEPWQLIIVDNGSTDGTAAVLRDAAQRASRPISIVTESRPGLARARNAGIADARGEILAFTDDDCYPREDFLEQLLAAFQDPRVGYVGGRVLLYDPSDAPITIRTDAGRVEIPACSFIPAGLLHGANLAVRRRLFADVGLFDPMLGAGTWFACEDVDLVARASMTGWAGCYDPGPVVYHHHGRKPGRDAERLAQIYSFARGAYYAKHLLSIAGYRRLYAGAWIRYVLRALRWRNLAAPARELAGALAYLAFRLCAYEATPRLSEISLSEPAWLGIGQPH